MAVLYSQERNIKVSIEKMHNQNYDVLEIEQTMKIGFHFHLILIHQL